MAPSTSRWKWQIFFALCSLGLALFLALRSRPSVLPSSYALCSHHAGRAIYTVDINNARTDCIVVKDSRIFDVGSRGRAITPKVK
jgi:hypothetical protein